MGGLMFPRQTAKIPRVEARVEVMVWTFKCQLWTSHAAIPSKSTLQIHNEDYAPQSSWIHSKFPAFPHGVARIVTLATKTLTPQSNNPGGLKI